MSTATGAPNDEQYAAMVARRVAGGFNEAESRAMLDDLLATCGRGTLGAALAYQGFTRA